MEYQKRSTSKYEVGQFYGCLQLLEKLSNNRWDPDKGYTIENCVPCCKYCNRMKSDLQPGDFYYKISLIYKRSIGSTTIEKHESELSRVESSDSKREESDNVSDCEIV